MGIYGRMSAYRRVYGKSLVELASELGVRVVTLSKWNRQGYDVRYKAAQLNAIRGNRRLQRLWDNLTRRCGDPSYSKFKNYGGRGIRVRMEKADLKYLWDRDGAEKMRQPSLDRINSNGHYERENCRFVEMSVNRMEGLRRAWATRK